MRGWCLLVITAAMAVAEPYRAAIAFHQAMEDSANRLLGESHISAETFLLGLRESLAACLAFEPLDAIPPTSSLHHLDFAVVARQIGPCFLRANASKMTGSLSNSAFGAIPRLDPSSS